MNVRYDTRGRVPEMTRLKAIAVSRAVIDTPLRVCRSSAATKNTDHASRVMKVSGRNTFQM